MVCIGFRSRVILVQEVVLEGDIVVGDAKMGLDIAGMVIESSSSS